MAEYTRVYIYGKTLSNHKTENATQSVAFSDFNMDPNTTAENAEANVGLIKSISIEHWHTATGGATYPWELAVILTTNSGETYQSDTVSQACNNTVTKWTNTINDLPASVFNDDGIRTISIVILNTNIDARQLYWRSINEGSNADHRIKMSMEFEDVVPSAPVISATSFTGKNSTFNTWFKGVTKPTFNHTVTADTAAGATITSRKLELFNAANHARIQTYTITSTSQQLTNPIPVAGNIDWIFTVVDSFGNSAEATGQIEVTDYTAPSISKFIGERYSYDENTQTYIADNMGTHVWFTVQARICSISKNSHTNSGTVKISFHRADGSTSYSAFSNQPTISNGGTYSATKSTDYNPSSSSLNFSTTVKYEFKIEVTDALKTTTTKVIVQDAKVLLSVEKAGVAVGKYATAGTEQNPVFEIDMPVSVTDPAQFRTAIGASGGKVPVNMHQLGSASGSNTLQIKGNSSVTSNGFVVFVKRNDKAFGILMVDLWSQIIGIMGFIPTGLRLNKASGNTGTLTIQNGTGSALIIIAINADLTPLEDTETLTENVTRQYSGAVTSLSPNATTVASETVVSLSNIELAAGSYILEGVASFGTNTSGYRQLGFGDSATQQNRDRFAVVRSAPVAGAATVLTLSMPIEVASTTTLYLNAYQNSGSSLTVTGGIRAIRI